MRKATDWSKYKKIIKIFDFYLFFEKLVINGYKDLLKCADLNKKISVAELGCGTGRLSKWLCSNYYVEKITLVDSNNEMLEIAKKEFLKVSCKKELIQKDFFKFNPKEKYDLVHSQGVIEHFEPAKRKELLKKHLSILKKGGYCVIYFPTPTFFYNFWKKIMKMLNLWIFHDEVPLKKETVMNEMESLGAHALKSNIINNYGLTEAGIIFKKN